MDDPKGPVQGADDALLKIMLAIISLPGPPRIMGGRYVPGGQDENQETTGADPGQAQGQGHLPKGLPFGAAHAPGRFGQKTSCLFLPD